MKKILEKYINVYREYLKSYIWLVLFVKFVLLFIVAIALKSHMYWSEYVWLFGFLELIYGFLLYSMLFIPLFDTPVLFVLFLFRSQKKLNLLIILNAFLFSILGMLLTGIVMFLIAMAILVPLSVVVQFKPNI